MAYLGAPAVLCVMALKELGKKFAEKISASEETASASEILSHELEVNVEKPERMVLRRRNIAALLRMEASGLSGRIDFKTAINSYSEILFSVVTIARRVEEFLRCA